MIGRVIQVAVFGESHGKGVGATIEGIPDNIPIDMMKLRSHMKRRSSKGNLTTTRREEDNVTFLSGLKNGKTNGYPITIYIENNDVRTKDYNLDLIRPSHADYTAYEKYENPDLAGGGYFSARLMAAVTAVGFIAKEVLERIYNVEIYSHISTVYDIVDTSFFDCNDIDKIRQIKEKEIEIIDDTKKVPINNIIVRARKEKESLSSSVEVMATGLKPGEGSLMFDAIDSTLSRYFFTIPAVKSVRFGKDTFKMKGSTYNDNYFIENNNIHTFTNNQGGITGGLANGNPIIAEIGFKPTPTIAKAQRSVNVVTRTNEIIETHGRHDPCVGLRAPVIAESMMALGLLDIIRSENN